MFIVDLLYALFIGLSIAWFFSLFFGHRGPWNNFFLFFIVVFLFSWGGGVWITPVGPTFWGVSFLPFLFMAIFITLLLSVATPRSARRRKVSKEKAIEETELQVAFDIFYWILIIVLAVVVFSPYVFRLRPF